MDNCEINVFEKYNFFLYYETTLWKKLFIAFTITGTRFFSPSGQWKSRRRITALYHRAWRHSFNSSAICGLGNVKSAVHKNEGYEPRRTTPLI